MAGSPNWQTGYVPSATEWNEVFAGKLDVESPAMAGVPTAPNPIVTDNSTAVATTAFVNEYMGTFGPSATALLKAQNLADVTNPSAAISNIGGLDRANNLSDVASPSTSFANLMSLASGAGAVARSAQSKVNDMVSVSDYGAVSGSALDQAPFFQAAIDANSGKAIYVPPGIYYFDTGLTLPIRSSLIGAGHEQVLLIIRSAIGDFITSGSPSDPAAGALGSTIAGLWMLVDRPVVDASTTTLVNRDVSNSAFIRLHGARHCHVRDNLFWWKSRHVSFDGGSLCTVTGNMTAGVWDPDNTNLQECVASFEYLKSAVHGIPKDMHILNNEVYGGQGAVRSVSYAPYGSVSESVSIGPRYGVYANALETAYICNNYFGQCGQYGNYFNVNDLIGNIIIGGNFYDQSNSYEIYWDNVGTAYGLNVSIEGNRFNGQTKARHAIGVAPQASTTPVISTLTITGNTMASYSMCPVMIAGAKGGAIAGNSFRDYNCKYAVLSSGADTDALYASAIYLNTDANYINVVGNTWGGGGNVYDTVNNGCSYGVYAIPSGGALLTESSNIPAGINIASTVGMISSDPAKTAFRARGVTAATGTGYKVFWLEDFDYGSHYDNGTGIFTAPTYGLYSIYAQGTSDAAGGLAFTVDINGSALMKSQSATGSVSTVTMSMNAQLAPGDTVRVNVVGGNFVSGGIVDSMFSIALIRTTGIA